MSENATLKETSLVIEELWNNKEGDIARIDPKLIMVHPELDNLFPKKEDNISSLKKSIKAGWSDSTPIRFCRIKDLKIIVPWEGHSRRVAALAVGCTEISFVIDETFANLEKAKEKMIKEQVGRRNLDNLGYIMMLSDIYDKQVDAGKKPTAMNVKSWANLGLSTAKSYLAVLRSSDREDIIKRMQLDDSSELYLGFVAAVKHAKSLEALKRVNKGISTEEAKKVLEDQKKKEAEKKQEELKPATPGEKNPVTGGVPAHTFDKDKDVKVVASKPISEIKLNQHTTLWKVKEVLEQSGANVEYIDEVLKSL